MLVIQKEVSVQNRSEENSPFDNVMQCSMVCMVFSVLNISILLVFGINGTDVDFFSVIAIFFFNDKE